MSSNSNQTTDKRLIECVAEARSVSSSRITETLLSQIGKESDEKIWTDLFAYFCDPDADHNLGSEFLDSYLQRLNEIGNSPVDPEVTSIADTKVIAQPRLEGRNADVLIYQPDSWVILIEGKVGADVDSDKLSDYADASRIEGGIKVEEMEDVTYILLTLPEGDYEKASDTEFCHHTWEEVLLCINEVRTNLTLNDITKGKLNEFGVTMERKMGKIDRSEQLRYAELFDDYRDEIEEVYGAPQKLAEEVMNNWEGIIETGKCSPETDGWVLKKSSADNNHIVREGWNYDELSLHLEVTPTDAYEERKVFEEGRFRIRLQSHEKDGIRSEFKEGFYEKFEGGEHSESNVHIKNKRSGGQATFTETEYGFNVGGNKDDYYSRLEDAIDDHAKLCQEVDRIVEGIT